MNFSSSDIWNNSLFIRYPIDKIKKIENLYFYDDNNTLMCQTFFNPSVGDNVLNELKSNIINSKTIRFNYINNGPSLCKIKEMAEKNNFVYEVIDSWDAPILDLNESLVNYIKNKCGLQMKRNYKIYLKNKLNYKFYNSAMDNSLDLWKYVLDIDSNSWKKRESSDMKSLNREDLQYLPFLLIEKEKSNLIVVCDLDDQPLAYSLMFKGEDDYWYAVKWGASYQGRKNQAGFSCLFYHLEYLYSLTDRLNIDFWGRRSRTYNYLKNGSIIRSHVAIYKKED